MNAETLVPAATKRIGLNSFVYVAGDLLGRGAVFLLLPLYTRVLSPDEYGAYGVLLSLLGFLNVVLPLQFNSALTMHYFQLRANERRELVSAVSGMVLGAAILLTGILVGTQAFWAPRLFPDVPFSPQIVYTLAIAFFATAGVVPQTLLRLREQPIRLVVITSAVSILGLVSGALLLTVFHAGVPGLLLGLLTGNAFGCVFYMRVLRDQVTLRIPQHWFRDIPLLCLPLVPHMISHWGLNLMDRVILQGLVPLRDVGIYQLGYQVATVFQVIVLAFNNAWVPYFFQGFGDVSASADIGRLSTLLLFMEGWMALAIAIVGPELVTFLIPAEYHAAVDVIPWVVLGFFMLAVYHLLVNPLLYHRRTTLVPAATAAAAIANLAINLALIPRLGYIGAAISTSICYALLALFTWLISRRIGVTFGYEPAEWAKIATVGLAMYFASQLFGASGLGLRFGGEFLAMALFPALLGLLGFWRPGELRAMKGYFARPSEN